jgi:hypothetical protein
MKTVLFAGASALALAVGAGWTVRAAKPYATCSAQNTLSLEDAQPGSAETARVTRNFLLYFVIPVWIGAGLADWLCHRASDVEHTGGPEESLLHLLMLAEVGVPALAALFLEVTSPLFGLMIAAFVLHQATALWDVAYAVAVREVTPVEQQVHDFLALMPLMALSFLAVLHWQEFLGLFGLDDGSAQRGIKPKRDPLPTPVLATILGAIAVFNGLPYLEELWRGLRVRFSEDERPRASTETRSKSPTTATLANRAPASAAISAGS